MTRIRSYDAIPKRHPLRIPKEDEIEIFSFDDEGSIDPTGPHEEQQQQEDPRPSLLCLPNEILVRVFGQGLSAIDMARTSQTCILFHNLIADTCSSHIWRKLFLMNSEGFHSWSLISSARLLSLDDPASSSTLSEMGRRVIKLGGRSKRGVNRIPWREYYIELWGIRRGSKRILAGIARMASPDVSRWIFSIVTFIHPLGLIASIKAIVKHVVGCVRIEKRSQTLTPPSSASLSPGTSYSPPKVQSRWLRSITSKPDLNRQSGFSESPSDSMGYVPRNSSKTEWMEISRLELIKGITSVLYHPTLKQNALAKHISLLLDLLSPNETRFFERDMGSMDLSNGYLDSKTISYIILTPYLVHFFQIEPRC